MSAYPLMPSVSRKRCPCTGTRTYVSNCIYYPLSTNTLSKKLLPNFWLFYFILLRLFIDSFVDCKWTRTLNSGFEFLDGGEDLMIVWYSLFISLLEIFGQRMTGAIDVDSNSAGAKKLYNSKGPQSCNQKKDRIQTHSTTSMCISGFDC
jgi:hypothetical protein